jgi:hypothetical protein
MKAVTCADGNKASLPTRSADCSSVLQVTVTPAATTVRQVVTVTGHAVVVTVKSRTDTVVVASTNIVTSWASQATFEPGKRAAAAATSCSKPTYASACSNVAAYSSACACWGIAVKTVTAAAPTTTVRCTSTLIPTISVGIATVTVTTVVAAAATETSAVGCTFDTIWLSGSASTSCGCNYKRVSCYQPVPSPGSVYTTTTAKSATDCATQADANAWAFSFGYNQSTGQCIIMAATSPTTVVNNSWNTGYRLGGCNNNSCNPTS